MQLELSDLKYHVNPLNRHGTDTTHQYDLFFIFHETVQKQKHRHEGFRC